MARFVSFVDDQWQERVGLERGGQVFALPVGLTLPVLLSLGADVVASLAEAASARPAAGQTEELRLQPPVPNPGKILCLAGNYQEHIREGGGAEVDKTRSTPHLFIKPRTCLAPPGATVARSRMTD